MYCGRCASPGRLEAAIGATCGKLGASSVGLGSALQQRDKGN
jgi:hypothetical protein